MCAAQGRKISDPGGQACNYNSYSASPVWYRIEDGYDIATKSTGEHGNHCGSAINGWTLHHHPSITAPLYLSPPLQVSMNHYPSIITADSFVATLAWQVVRGHGSRSVRDRNGPHVLVILGLHVLQRRKLRLDAVCPSHKLWQLPCLASADADKLSWWTRLQFRVVCGAHSCLVLLRPS